ncbi:hypothetical protein M8818_001086 [Zalaria obscura]|uniref:Uncharacterized protein n=1 Tax=Zalaria obscura TaxID=2024903 RepID=A0ACC3SLJ8_9PEZI
MSEAKLKGTQERITALNHACARDILQDKAGHAEMQNPKPILVGQLTLHCGSCRYSAITRAESMHSNAGVS